MKFLTSIQKKIKFHSIIRLTLIRDLAMTKRQLLLAGPQTNIGQPRED